MADSFKQQKRKRMYLRIAAWNIDAGGGNRLDAIAACVQSLEVDVLILDEFRTGLNGMVLRGHLDRAGLVYQTPCETDPDRDTVILASRFPFVELPLPEKSGALGSSLIHALIGGCRLLAVHAGPEDIPDPLLDPVCTIVRTWTETNGLLVAIRRTDRPFPGQRSLHRNALTHPELARCGLVDVRSLLNKEEAENSRSTSESSTIPVAFAMVTRTLSTGLKTFGYLHGPTRQGISRNPVLTLEIDPQPETPSDA
jgi:hypothetical protein